MMIMMMMRRRRRLLVRKQQKLVRVDRGNIDTWEPKPTVPLGTLSMIDQETKSQSTVLPPSPLQKQNMGGSNSGASHILDTGGQCLACCDHNQNLPFVTHTRLFPASVSVPTGVDPPHRTHPTLPHSGTGSLYS